MIQKFTVLSGLVLSATCMVLHQPSLPLRLGLQYNANPNYNFAYEVNDPHTGDIKSQHESRRGDAVLGQYSLVQPDGLRRTVDYRADDHSGFQAAVNNNGGVALAALEATRQPGIAVQPYQQRPASTAYPSTAYPSSAYPTPAYPSTTYPSTAYSSNAYPSPAYPSSAYPSPAYPSTPYPSTAYSSNAYPSPAYPSSAYPSPAPTAGAVSRTSFIQTIAHSPVAHNPWP